MIVLPWLTKTEWSLAKYKSISTLWSSGIQVVRGPTSHKLYPPTCFFGKFREFEHAKGKRVGH